MSKPKEIKRTKITSLDQLQKLVAAPVIVRFKIDEQPLELEVNRATPHIMEEHRKILRAVQPPYNAARKDYDPLDAKYLEARDAANRKARAFMVYSCCPAVASKKPGLINAEEIVAFVSQYLTENLLDIIYMSAQAGGVDIDRRVSEGGNFTQPPDLES